TRGKLAKTPFLRVDTGDPELDEKLKGYWKVVTDYGEYTVVKCI
ncbi:ATP-NAD kinase, partial [archaeon]